MNGFDPRFHVTIKNPVTGRPLTLPSARTAEEVEDLRARHEVISTEVVPDDKPNEFNVALTALIRCYVAAEKKGDTGLAKRAEAAVAELLGADGNGRVPSIGGAEPNDDDTGSEGEIAIDLNRIKSNGAKLVLELDEWTDKTSPGLGPKRELR